MGYRYVVLGSGRQGLAIAYDLAQHAEAERITLADVDVEGVRQGLKRLEDLLPQSTVQLAAAICDVSKPAEVAMAISGADVAVSAVPYRFNVPLTDAAIAAGASLCDLGGNTQVVMHQLGRHDRAAEAGVSILPDTGLAPGLGNILAAHGINQLDTPEHVHVRCGGLPQEAVGPLGYKLLFSFGGLINEYSGQAEFVRDGKIVKVPTLTELEELEFPGSVGRCEAAVTSGGTSTCPHTFAGRVKTYDYKTIRYPGHFAVVRALFELGCFEDYVPLAGGEIIEPRPLMEQLFAERLSFPDVPDIVVLRCTVIGQHDGQPRKLVYELVDRQDAHTGFSAMERTTGYPAALVAHMQARRLVEPGARPLELALPLEQYVNELAQHEIHVEMRAEV